VIFLPRSGHEKNGVASCLRALIRFLQAKYKVSRVHACEHILLFVPLGSPFVQGTALAVPSAQYAMAASPDALLIGNGKF